MQARERIGSRLGEALQPFFAHYAPCPCLDRMGGYADGEGHGQVGWRQAAPGALRPLDEPEAPWPRPIPEPERLELRFIAHAIEIDVQNRKHAKLMELEQCVGRTSHRVGLAETAQNTAREGRLARAEIARQVYEGEPVLIGWACGCELRSQLFGLFRGLGCDVHAARSRFTQ